MTGTRADEKHGGHVTHDVMSSSARDSTTREVAWVPILGGVALLWLLLTFTGLFSRVPWGRLVEVAVRPEFRDALLLSLRTCLISTVVVLVFGLPFALWMGRTARLAPALRMLVLLPMTLPPVVAGLALLSTFGRRGLLGAPLSFLGIEIGFTSVAVVMAQVFVSLPYFVVAVEAAHRVMDQAPGRALSFLGASPGDVLRHATLPALAPAIASGLSLAFARALGEFGATLTFAGSLQGTTRTMPLAIYLARESDSEISYALALALILTAIAAIGAGHGIARFFTRTRRPPLPETTHEPPPGPHAIAVDLRVRRSDRDVEADVQVPAGQTVALIGPNGSGKSTILETVAHAHGGRAALLTQDPALLGHLSALDNVALGPRIRGETSVRSRQIAAAVLTQVGIGELAERSPRDMSGGQRARVALARALAVEPGLILLDEPMAALDVAVSAEIRDVLERVLRGRTAILVSHDVLDLHLTERTLVLDRGRVVEDEATTTLLAAPTASFAQEFVGVNRLDAVVMVGEDGVVLDMAGQTTARADLPAVAGPAHVYFGAVARLAADPAEEAETLWLRGRVRGVVPALGSVSLALALADGQRCRVLVSASEVSRVGVGDEVWAGISAARVVPRMAVG